MASLQVALICLALPSAGETVLYDFGADWCVPCRMMEPVVSGLKAKGYPVRKVNIDREPALKRKFRIEKVPTFVLVKDGRVVARAMGMARMAQLEEMMNKVGVYPPGRNVQQALAQSPDPRSQNTQPQAMPASSSEALWQHHAGDSRGKYGQALATATQPTRGAAITGDMNSIRAKALAATVRLEINDRSGSSFGSGTIVDVDGDNALVLTCGHVFRNVDKRAPIKVTLYDRATPDTVEGRLVGFDLDRDIGLVSIRPRRPVAVVPVAPTGYRVGKGQTVVNVGCNHGAAPTVEVTRVTSLNKYQGPANLQTAGMPVQGRSGGGLFSADGYVVGVCNAADPADREGLFAAVDSIHRQLDDAKLTRIYRDHAAGPGTNTQLAATQPPPMPKHMPKRLDDRIVAADTNWQPGTTIDAMPKAIPATAAASDLASRSLSAAETAALSQIQRGLGQSEVILIISNPNGRSEVIVLDKASPAFRKRAEAMAAAYRSEPKPHYTSHEVSDTPPSESVWQPRWR
jgi:thiol-disulfide isomerase/thioredoxin